MESIVQFYLVTRFLLLEHIVSSPTYSFNENSRDFCSFAAFWELTLLKIPLLLCRKNDVLSARARFDRGDLNAIPRTRRIKCASWRNAELKVVVDISLPGIGTHRASRRGGLTYTGYNIRLRRIDGDDSRIKYQRVSSMRDAERISIQWAT